MATRRWRGDAVPVADVWTITPGGTIGTETFTMTINGKDVTYTAQSGDTVALVVAGLVAAWNNSTIPEFAEATAVNSTTHATITMDAAGVPMVVTCTASGSATLTPSNTTAATGPNFFSNADNWTGGAVPVDGDTVVFDSGGVSCKYGISQSALTPAAFTVTMGFTGEIGLPESNVSVGGTYREYRTKFLTWCDSGDATNTSVRIGDGVGSGSGRLRLSFNTGRVTGMILNSGQRTDEGEPAITIQGSNANSEWNVLRGDVGFAFYAGESTQMATLRVGYIDNPIGDARVECGADLATLTLVELSGGETALRSAVTTLSMWAGICSQYAGAVATLSIDGGTYYPKGTSTVTTLNLGSGGNFDRRQDARDMTITNTNFYEGFEYHDPNDTITNTNGIDFIRTTPAGGVFDVAPNKTWTASTI